MPTRHTFVRGLTFLIALVSLSSLAAGQNPGTFQGAINYSAGPPTVASNTGFLFGGIMPLEAHTRDSNGHLLDFDGDGKPDVVVAASCYDPALGAGLPGCPASGSAVVVYLSNGDGTFTPGIIAGGPATALRSIAIGDFDGDGKLDVVAASDSLSSQDGSSGSMIVLLGNGDGTFTPGAYYPLGGVVSQANTVAVADFNGDGKPDIAVGLTCFNIAVNGCSVGAVSIFLDNGDGTFSGPAAYETVGNSALYLAVGDFNRDGKLDIIAGSPTASGNSASSLTILLGVGDGTFTSQQPPNLPFYGLSAVAAVDLNSDGNLDLAMTSGPGAIQVLTGNGDGTFLDPVTYNTALGNAITNGTPLTVADLNGDGKPDLIVSGTLAGFNGAQVFLNNGTGNLIAGDTYTAGGWLYAPIDVADFNGDGKTDLVLVSGCAEDERTGGQLCPDGTLTVLLGNGDGTLRSARYISGGRNNNGYSVSVAAADFNGDGFQDLVVPGCTPGNVCSDDGFTLLLSDGAGGYQAPLFFSSSPATGAMYLTVADFNGDGRPDVALFDACDDGPYNCTDDAVSVFLNTGDPTNLFSTAAVYESGGTGMAAQTIVAGDFNGDSKPDIALLHCCTSSGQNLLSVLLNNGDGTFQQPAVTKEVANGTASWIAAADFDRDGKTDLVVAENTYDNGYYSDVVEILLSGGDGKFTSVGSYPAGGAHASYAAASVATGDISRDGKPDIVVGNTCDQAAGDANCARGAIGVLLGNGDGTFQPAVTSTVPDGNFLATSLADMNGDGKLDEIASTLTGIYVAFGNGDGTFQPGTIYAALRVDQNVQLAIADLNNDGALDIIQPGDNGQLAILYNQASNNSLAATTTTITAPAITYGDTANITVSVTSGQGAVSGNVSLAVDNGVPVTQALSGGSTIFNPSGLAGGNHSLTASYAVQGSFAASSANGALQVNQAQPTVTFTGAPASAPYQSTFTVASTTNASTTATITASGGCSIAGNTVTMTSAAGTCSLTASWAADSNYLAASASQSTAATKIAPTVTFTGAPAGASYHWTFTVATTTNASTTATITASGACSIGGKMVTMTSGAGVCSLTANWPADNIYMAATANQSTTAFPATTSITMFVPNSSVAGQPVTVKFSVIPVAPSYGTPTGNVTVSDGAGDTCTGTVAAGSCTLIFPTAGTVNLRATYNGDVNFNPVDIVLQFKVVDFLISAATTSQSIKAGQKTTYSVSLSPQNGFTGSISFSCGGAPPSSTCTVPKSITLTKTTSVSFSVSTSKNTPKAKYTLTFTGKFGSGVPATGGLTHNTSANLTVN